MKQLETTSEEILKVLSRYQALLTKLHRLITLTENGITRNHQWFSCAPMVARKFWKQALSLEILFNHELSFNAPSSERAIVDLSSYYALLRAMFEGYAVFCHLFKVEANSEENIIRFSLWQIDGLENRLKFSRENPGSELLIQLDEDRQYINQLQHQISTLNYFQNMDPRYQRYLMDRRAWKFSSSALQHSEKRKWQHSITELIERTKIKEYILKDLYSYYSMHAHTGYISILQNDSMPEKDKMMGKWVAVMNGSYIVAFMIDDLAKMFAEGKAFYKSLTQQEAEGLASFLKGKE